MGILFIILGGALLYFGTTFKIGNKKLADMQGGDLFKTGIKGYFKIMMLLGGVAFLLIGLMWSCIGVIM